MLTWTNAIYLGRYGWYRVDARGNKLGVEAQFTPPEEQLAYGINLPEELDCKHIFASPLPVVIRALQTYDSWDNLLRNLPDIKREGFSQLACQK